MYTFTRYATLITAGSVICAILTSRTEVWLEIFGYGTLIAFSGFLAFKIIPERFQVTSLALTVAFLLLGAPVLSVIGSLVEPLPFIEFGDHAFSKMSLLMYEHAQITINVSTQPTFFCGVIDNAEEKRKFITAVASAVMLPGLTAAIEFQHFKELDAAQEVEDYLANT